MQTEPDHEGGADGALTRNPEAPTPSACSFSEVGAVIWVLRPEIITYKQRL